MVERWIFKQNLEKNDKDSSWLEIELWNYTNLAWRELSESVPKIMQSITQHTHVPQAKTYTLSFSKAAHHTCQHTNLGNIMRDHRKISCPAWKYWADLKSSKRAKVFWSVKRETALSKTQVLFTSFLSKAKTGRTCNVMTFQSFSFRSLTTFTRQRRSVQCPG